MPTYAFRCPSCATTFEEKRPFARADDPATCPTCGGDKAAKVIGLAEFYSPGAAAKSLLDPGSRQKATAPAHAAGCPCCTPRKPATTGTQA